MKNNTLRSPLIKSAALLAAFSLVIYLTISSPEGSVWNSIGAIFYTVFRAAQFAVGLILALIVCFAVLLGIFFGCLAMVSTESAAKMYNRLYQYGSDNIHAAQSLFRLGNKKRSRDFSGDRSPRHEGISLQVSNVLEDIKRSQRLIEEKLHVLQTRIEQDEQDEGITRLSNWLRSEEESSKEVQKTLAMFDQQMRQVQGQVQEQAVKLVDLAAGESLKEITGRVAALEETSRDLLAGIESIREEIEFQGKKLEDFRQGSHDSSAESEGYRLLSYIKNADDREKIVHLVVEAVKQDMTYAQATEHIIGNVSGKTAGIIGEHPTLTQEFIRAYRKKN